MKNCLQIILVLLFVTICLSLKGQNFNGGFYGGLSATQISGDNLGGFNKAGIYGGGFANLYIKERMSLQLEISYIEKGSRQVARPDKGIIRAYTLKLNYLEIPFLLKFDYRKPITFEIGLAYGVLVKSSEEDESGAFPYSPPFDKYDLSLIGGVYYRLSDRIKVNVRYSNSVVPVRKHSSGAHYYFNFGQYNEVMTFTLQYFILRDER